GKRYNHSRGWAEERLLFLSCMSSMLFMLAEGVGLLVNSLMSQLKYQ
ncbi:MAG: hypothetical protein ACI88A_005245, partial [Paraglaciecola sp.]